MNVTEYSKYALSILFIFIIYLSYLLIKPYLLAIISAVILTYVFSPLYNLLNKPIKNKYACSLTVLILITLLFSIPSIFLLHSLSTQGYEQYNALKEFVSNPNAFQCITANTDFCALYFNVFSAENRILIEEFAKNSLLNIAQKSVTASINFLAALPSKAIEFCIMVFIMFFLFADGKTLFAKIVNFFPMKIEHEKYLLGSLKETTDAVVFGQVSIALLQGILAVIGFWLIGVNHAVLLGGIVAFLGVIPFLGPTVVWVPLMIYYLTLGIQTDSNTLIIKAIIIAIYGAIVLGTVETFLKPKIIGDKAKLHPALVFMGIIGGLSLFGFIGFFVGPIILGILSALIKIYEKEKIIQLKKRG
ncbi:MAG: AI-2E family transporter [Candidatus Woesearchaeota archaeon]|jgi:predicted PurR-regulated permease PerM